MFRKVISTIILVPLAVIIIGFAVANRQAVTVSFDPFASAAPAYAVTLPLFLLLFALLILGVIIGGIAAWLGQGTWRRAARKLDADVRALRGELEAFHRRIAAEREPAEPAKYPVIPPPS